MSARLDGFYMNVFDWNLMSSEIREGKLFILYLYQLRTECKSEQPLKHVKADQCNLKPHKNIA